MKRTLATVVIAALAVLAACDKQADTTATAATATATSATSIPAGKNWLEEMAATPEGGYRLGNPDAPVKLVEYASLTCPHCRDFKDESDADLHAKYIATGKISYEYRNFLLNPADMAASVLARCEGPRQFFNLMNAFYAAQNQWTEPFYKMAPADQQKLQALPQDQQIAAYAKVGGLDAFMKARGMTSAQFDKCLADPAAVKRLTDIRDTAVNTLAVDSTPTFFINGVKQAGVNTWPQLQPKLIAALQ